MKRRRVLVLGTGTEIGKTHVTMRLLSYAQAMRRSVRADKPIATGIARRCECAERHAEALDAPYLHPTFAYRRPVCTRLAVLNIDNGYGAACAAVRVCRVLDSPAKRQ